MKLSRTTSRFIKRMSEFFVPNKMCENDSIIYKLAWERGYRKAWCESDSMELILLVHYANEEMHLFHTVRYQISKSTSLRKDWDVSIIHVLCEANTCANFFC